MPCGFWFLFGTHAPAGRDVQSLKVFPAKQAALVLTAVLGAFPETGRRTSSGWTPTPW